MADNSTLPAVGTVVATDDVGGVQYQRVKLDVGGDGATIPVVGALPIGGEVAHGIGDSGNPVKMGGKASSTTPTPVTTGNRVDTWHDVYGRQVIAELDPELNLATGITTYRERVVSPRYTVLADSIADGLAVWWTQTTANGGSISIATGEGLIQSGTSATGSAQLSSTAPAYLPGQSHWLLTAARFGDTGSAGNTRRIGAFTVSGTTPQNGFYFELADTVLNVVSVKAGVATAFASNAWSRVSTAPFTLDANYHLFEIRWTANRADFYIDNLLRHTMSVTTSAITATLNFPMTIQSVSTSGATNRVMVVRNIGLGRFGTPSQQAISPDATMQSAATAVGNGVAMDAIGYGTASIQISGTFVGTVTFEGTLDGTNYVGIAATQMGTSAIASTATGPGIYRISMAGLHNIRARVSAYTSGSITAIGHTLNAPYAPKFIQSAAGTNAIGDVGLQYRANATGAASSRHLVSAASTNAASVKASPGRVLGWALLNTTNAPKYVKLHNTAGTPTAGAGVVQTIAIPGNGLAQFHLDGGIAFSTGIGLTATGGTGADADTVATAVGDIVGDLFYA